MQREAEAFSCNLQLRLRPQATQQVRECDYDGSMYYSFQDFKTVVSERLGPSTALRSLYSGPRPWVGHLLFQTQRQFLVGWGERRTKLHDRGESTLIVIRFTTLRPAPFNLTDCRLVQIEALETADRSAIVLAMIPSENVIVSTG